MVDLSGITGVAGESLYVVTLADFSFSQIFSEFTGAEEKYFFMSPVNAL